jgi:hypothetical protein
MRRWLRTIEYSLQCEEVGPNWNDDHGKGEAKKFVDDVPVEVVSINRERLVELMSLSSSRRGAVSGIDLRRDGWCSVRHQRRGITSLRRRQRLFWLVRNDSAG